MYSHPNAEIGRIGDTHSNFHFEFRRTQLEAEKKRAQLVDDVSMIKNTLRIPGKDAATELYLSSDFFKARATKVVPRGNKDRDISRARTKFFFAHLTAKPEEGEAVSGKSAFIQRVCIAKASKMNRETTLYHQ